MTRFRFQHLLVAVAALVLPSTQAVASGPVPTDATQVEPLSVGDAAPAFDLRQPDGAPYRFEPATLEKPVLLVFYRGGWCPFCNRHLSELRDAEPKIRELGYDVLFLSADRPEILYSSLKTPDLGYRLLSDARMEGARAMGIAFRVDDATIERYRKHGIDLEAASGEVHHELPVPAVFLLDREGTIRFVHANPDYKVRIDGAELLEVARAGGLRGTH